MKASALSIGFTASGLPSLPCCHVNRYHTYSCFLGQPFSLLRRLRRSHGCCYSSKNGCLVTVRASQEEEKKQFYHPFEEIEDRALVANGEDVHLTPAETARTVIEVNSKATIMFTGFADEDVHENIVWPDLPYLTDEHGDIYFDVNSEEEILQSLIMDEKLVQVIIGLDNTELLAEMDEFGPSGIDFGIEDLTSEESDTDDVYEEDAIEILEDEIDEILSSEGFGDWTNLETMQSCHPVYFADKIVEAISSDNLDWMKQPPASVVIQGYLRPAFADDRKEKKLQSGSNRMEFYKLEMIKIQLISSYGSETPVKVQDFRKAQPDVIAHSAANIIARLNGGGEKIIQALRSLCWRQKVIHVEEAVVIGVDSLGFDVRICSGRQVQTLRFAFNSRATSEFSAEKQVYDLLFPRIEEQQNCSSKLSS